MASPWQPGRPQRAPEHALGCIPGGHRQRLTILGAIAQDGLVAVMTIAAVTSTAVFLAFLEGVVIPTLRARPAEHRYLPAYSPEPNPIELAWSKPKGRLRSVAPRTIEALETALPDAINTITPSDAHARFQHCGYRSA